MAIYVASGIPRTECVDCVGFCGCLRASLLSFISPRPIVILVLGKLSPLFSCHTYTLLAGLAWPGWSYHRLAAELGWAIIIWETYWPLQSTSTSGLRHSYIHSFDNTVMEFCTVCGGCGWETWDKANKLYDITGIIVTTNNIPHAH